MDKRIIIKNTDGSISIVIPSGEMSIEEVFKKDVPEGLTAEIVDVLKIPTDRTFRNGWKHDPVKKIGFDVGKCKEITHNRRRVARSAEFAPHDEIIARQVPGSGADAAEKSRADIRTKYDGIQIAIDACNDEIGLKEIIDAEKI